jgi:phosphoglycerol transferase MdoB-like AlkP superfamily enzyme
MFYSRGDLLDMIGFENLYFHDELFDGAPRWEWDGNLTLDSVTAERMSQVILQTDDPFYYFWTTLLMHGPYNEGETNIQLFEDLGYFDAIELAESNGTWVNPLIGQDEIDIGRMKYYQAAMMDFDAALGILMDKLEEEGELDRTLFVIYGDHTAYYHKFNHLVLSDDGELRPYYDMELYTSFLCFYNEDLTQAYLNDHSTNQITSFTSPLVIVPTVLDLLGETYNQYLMLNDNVFMGLEHVFYSNKLTTFFTDQVYSDNGYDIIYEQGIVSDEYIEEFRYQSDVMIDKLNWINQYYNANKEEKTEEIE